MKSLTRLAREFGHRLEGLSPETAFVMGLIYVLILGVADFFMLGEMSFTLFYVVGCAAVGWQAGRRLAVALCMVVMVLIAVHDVTFPPIGQTTAWLVAWKITTRITVVGLAAWLAAEVSRLARNLTRMVEERTAAWRAETERHKLTSERLAETVQRFEQVAANVAEVFWLWDLRAGCLAYVSPAYARVWGASPERLFREPQSWLERVHPEDRERVRRWGDAMPEARATPIEYRILRPEGEIRWVRDRAFPVRDASGTVHRLAGLAEDITAQRNVENTLRTQSWILQNMGEAMIMTDLAGTIEVLNPAAERLMGYSAGELTGKSISLLSPFPETQTPEKFRALQHQLEQQPQWVGELPIRRKDGRVLIAHVNVTRLQLGQRTVLIALYEDVTQQREAEAQLRAREQRLQLGLEAARMIIWEAELASGTVNYSQGVKEFFGGRELLPYQNLESYTNMIHPDDREAFRQKMRTVAAQKSPSEHEYRVRHTDGSWRWVLTKGQAMSDEGGTPVRLTGVTLDITERKQAEGLLQQQAQILEQTHDSIVASDLDGKILFSNKGTERLLGYSAQELVGKHISLLHFEEDMQYLRGSVLERVLTDGQHEVEVRTRRKSGEAVTILLSLSQLRDAGGKVQGVIGSAVDITERKKSEEAIRESEAALQATSQMLRTIIETAPVAIIGFDLEGRVRDVWNPAAERMLGWRREEVLGQPLPCVPEESRAHSNELMRRLSEGQLVSDVDVHRRRKDGSAIDYTIYAAPLYDAAGRVTGNISVHVDITRRKRAEQQLADALDLNMKMVSVSPVGIAAYKESGQCVFANAALARIVGGQVEDHLAVNFLELTQWREGGLLEMASKALREGRAGTTDVHGRSTFGKECWLQVDFARFTSGGERHLLAVFHDVGERRRAEEALALSQSKLSAAMDLAKLAHWEYDFATGCYAFDDRFYALYGTTAEREGGCRMSPETYAREFVFPEDAYLVFEGISAAAATTDPNYLVHLDHRIRRRDGDARHLAVLATVAKDAAGKTLKIRGVNQDITDRKRAEQQIIEISDREQARMGQDLHDGLCQQLVSLAFDANALRRKLLTLGLPESAAAARLADDLDQAITESRRVSRGLFPIRLEAEGLASALEELARTTQTRFGLECRYDGPQLVPVLDLAIATHLFRIAQEAVNNSVKHGRPKTVSIRLVAQHDSLELEIIDDGVGLCSGAAAGGQSGMGLHIMRYRAGSIGATLSVGPGPAGGTVVSCCVPWPPRYSPNR